MSTAFQVEKRVKIARLCIARTHSGCGKTTVFLGIMAALVQIFARFGRDGPGRI